MIFVRSNLKENIFRILKKFKNNYFMTFFVKIENLMAKKSKKNYFLQIVSILHSNI